MSPDSIRGNVDGRQSILRSMREVLDQIERCAEIIGNNQEAQALLDSAGDKLYGIMRELRRGTSPLGDLSLHGQDLKSGLEALTNHARQALGAPLELLIDGDVSAALGPVQAGHLLHIVREALANAILHAGASRMALRATVENQRLVLRLSDDGRGFDAKAQRHSLVHGGLAVMQQRADAARCFLQVASAPGAGTIVTVTLPLRSQRTRQRA